MHQQTVSMIRRTMWNYHSVTIL